MLRFKSVPTRYADEKVYISERRVGNLKTDSAIPKSCRHANVSDIILTYSNDLGFMLNLKKIGAVWAARDGSPENGHYALDNAMKLVKVEKDVFFEEVPPERRIKIRVSDNRETPLLMSHIPVFLIAGNRGAEVRTTVESSFLLIFNPENSLRFRERVAFVSKTRKTESVYNSLLSASRK